jgi:predicted Zn-dependent peptidase
MQGESTGARAGAIASDWHHLGRLRSLEEMSEAIDAVTAEHVLEYLRTYPAREFTVAIIGPEALDVSAVREG